MVGGSAVVAVIAAVFVVVVVVTAFPCLSLSILVSRVGLHCSCPRVDCVMNTPLPSPPSSLPYFFFVRGRREWPRS